MSEGNEAAQNLAERSPNGSVERDENVIQNNVTSTTPFSSLSALHSLIILSDSALPLGSFAFSAGLESFLAHERLKSPSRIHSILPPGAQATSSTSLASFTHFLHLSLASLASTALPYVLEGWRYPLHLKTLDNDFDASTPCTVARRASVAQGRALLGVWERSFKPHFASPNPTINDTPDPDTVDAIAALQSFQHLLRPSATPSDLPAYLAPAAHFPPLWGAVTRAMGVSIQEATYLFLFGHVRMVVSAGVRASVLGPYQAQNVLAERGLEGTIRRVMGECWGMETGDAGQCVPVLDLWVGRHELLYSRIFNS